jgi:autotransporter-associated beta strand protein
MSNVEGTRAASLRAITPGLTVFIPGNVALLSIDTNPTTEGTQDTLFAFNSGPTDGGPSAQGTIDIGGVISGAGIVQYGSQQQSAAVPLGKVILRSNNTYTGLNILSRGNLVLGHDNALGTGAIRQDGPSAIGMTGYNIESTDDSRVVANEHRMGQWQTIKGEHSITFSGLTYQTNTAGWINMMPSSETLTLSGPQYVFHMGDADDTISREYTFDGSGKTKVTGGIHSRWDEENDVEVINSTFPGSVTKKGSGAVYIDGNNDGVAGTLDSNFNAAAIVWGGNLHFATNGDVGAASYVESEAGAVGVDAGVVNNAAFFALLNNSSNKAPDNPDILNLVRYDRGGLMLGNGEYASNLDFTGAHVNARDMSLAAHEGGSTYTGTITTANDTYRFGGGSGTLTLPGTGPQAGPYTANQLTGANKKVEISNGGVVRITNTNNYTGSTKIVGEYVETLEVAAAQDTIFYDDGDSVPNGQIFQGTTLSVSTLANGGAVSSIGSSTNAAGNLVIDGSTFKYEGGAVSTDRLFTIGTAGATIDASGTGAVNFTNTGALVAAVAASRTGDVNAFAGGGGADLTTVRNIASTEGLHPGMLIMSPAHPTSGQTAGIMTGATITRVDPNEVEISLAVGEFAFYNDTTLTFGPAPERKLTLTGGNSGNNTLASVIANASDGGVVGVTKTGGGKWIITAANTYTGTTDVNAGTLLVNNASGSGTGTGAVNVNSGGTLGGTGSIGGAVVVNSGGHIAPGASIESLNVGGALTLSAGSILDFELAAPGNSDLINSTLLNGLSIAGGTVNLSNLGGLAAGTYTLIDYLGTITGTVDNLVFGSVPGGFGFDLVDTGNEINLLVTSVPTNDADFNNDGTINAADYVAWRKFNPRVSGATQVTGDADGDGDNDNTDYAEWMENFGEASPGAGGGGAVPEPSSAAIIGLIMVGFVSRSRRGR